MGMFSEIKTENDKVAARVEVKVEAARLRDAGWPHSLVKATVDDFDYWLMMRDGREVFFSSAADLGNGWVSITIHDLHERGPSRGALPPCPRGLEIRVADISMCSDAPYDS